jgi:antirestriction protein
MGTKSVDSLKNIWDSLNLTDSDGNAFNAGDIFATDEWGINSYKTLTSDNLQMYEELKTKLSEWLSANAGDKNASKVSAAITEITAGIQQYNNQEGRQTGLDYQVDQAADGLIEEFQNEIRTQWEYYEDDPDIGVNPDWLMDYVANATRFKIDDTTTPAEIEKLKDDVVSLMNIDWAQYGKDPENNPWTTF